MFNPLRSTNINPGEDMIYELRIYRCIPGRLPALLKRFETKTLDLEEARHPPGRLLDRADRRGQQRPALLLAWELLAEREQIWNAFQADPAWHSARAESEKDGPIIANIKSSILAPTAFSAMK